MASATATREERATWPWLPPMLMAVAEAHGLETALAFAARFGGQYVYIPAQPHPTHEVARAFGVPFLEWLIGHCGKHRRISMPKGPQDDAAQRREAVRAMTAKGCRTNEIARQLGLHARTVEMIRARINAADSRRQGDLFTPPKEA